MDPHARQRYEALRELRKVVASEHELDPEVMMGNSTLEEFAQNLPTSPDEVGRNKDIQGWREPIFAKRIFDCIDTLEYED
jgi:ribonuclease D